MANLLAAIDDSATATVVLRVARALGTMTESGVKALHVAVGDDGRTAATVAAASGVPLEVRRGEPRDEICAAASDPDVLAVVLGARSYPAGARPAGHVALDVIRAVEKPVVVVPPDAPDRPMRRVLVPLDGTGEVTTAVRGLLQFVPGGHEPELVALHVFGVDDFPAFSDQPGHETEAWAQEFLARHGALLPGTRLEVRVGMPADAVREVGGDMHADLVACGWKRNLDVGHAQVVRVLLADAQVPLVLVPLAELAA